MRYNPSKIEKKWQRRWLKEKIYEPDLRRTRRPFYNLMMFPYPSAEGLHIGSVRTFTGVDIYGRFKRMQGHDVFEPIGLDGFGIHSENYALKIGKHPAEQAKISEKNFYRQLGMIGNGFAWEEKLETYDPQYYKWTQWIFVQMFKRGLAYRKKAAVNWCPSCKTVLADEQVIAGACERCSTQVIKKDLEQWFFKITDYAERLLSNLEKIDWPEHIKIAQRNWIGKSEGALVKFPIVIARSERSERRGNPTRLLTHAPHGFARQNLSVLSRLRFARNDMEHIEVFTTRPDTLFGATYLVVAPEHPLLENQRAHISNWKDVETYIEQAEAKSAEERIVPEKEKTGVELKGLRVVNPVNNKEIPVWVADYALMEFGTGALFGDAHDTRDFAFAKKYKIPLKPTLRPADGSDDSRIRNLEECFTGEGILYDSGEFSGLSSTEAIEAITTWLSRRGHGKAVTTWRLRDWLISRQRYWGPPTPLIFCENCARRIKNQESRIKDRYNAGELQNPGWHTVPENDLPVKLPYIKEFRPTGTEKAPLAMVEKFYKVRCPKCRSWARRETDVSDTFLDSAWYYLRYPSVRIQHSKLKVKSGSSKFKVLEIPWNREITRRWLPVAMYIGGAEHAVLHLLYSRFLTMAFHDWGLLNFEEPFTKFRAHGLITRDGAKMSKSRGNVVNPDEYIKAFGADAIRMYLAFMAPLEQGGDFREEGMRGTTRFLNFVWQFVRGEDSKGEGTKSYFPEKVHKKIGKEYVKMLVHKTIKKVTDDIEALKYNTAISALMVCINEFDVYRDAVDKEDIKTFLKLLAPFAPHISEELWQQLEISKYRNIERCRSIHREPWPRYDPKFLEEETVTIVIQINGKVRDQVTVEKGVGEEAVRKKALGSTKVQKWLEGKTPQRVIVVPRKLVNIVV